MPNNIFKVGEVLEVEIQSLSFGGSGVAKKDNFVIFVPFSAPQDILKIQITAVKKNFAEAKILEVLKTSPHRRKPECPVYEVCGGCQLQHVEYQEQLRQKTQIIKDFFKKTHSKDHSFTVKDIVPCKNEFRYRNRIQLKYEDKKIGYYQKKTHSIVDINDCLLAEEKIANSILETKKAKILNQSTPIEKIEIAIDKAENLVISEGIKNDHQSYDGFSQVNRSQNDRIIHDLIEQVSGFSFSDFIDLYAGSGNFTFPLQKKFPKSKFVGVELNPGSVLIAKKTSQELNLTPKHVEFFLSDVDVFLRRFVIPQGSIVLLDPPRAGCSEFVIKSIAHSKASRVFYLSCDPASLIRDLNRLFEYNNHWKIQNIQPYDMFPQTYHIETLVELAVDR